MTFGCFAESARHGEDQRRTQAPQAAAGLAQPGAPPWGAAPDCVGTWVQQLADSAPDRGCAHVQQPADAASDRVCAIVQQFADKVVENINVEDDYVWVHDYHLLALPSLLRKVPPCLFFGLGACSCTQTYHLVCTTTTCWPSPPCCARYRPASSLGSGLEAVPKRIILCARLPPAGPPLPAVQGAALPLLYTRGLTVGEAHIMLGTRHSRELCLRCCARCCLTGLPHLLLGNHKHIILGLNQAWEATHDGTHARARCQSAGWI